MLQQILVAAIVVVAFVASGWKLMPARRRLRILVVLNAWAARYPRLDRWRQNFLQPRIARAAGSGCAGCAANVSRPQHPPR